MDRHTFVDDASVVVPGKGQEKREEVEELTPSIKRWPAEVRLYDIFPEEAKYAGTTRRAKKSSCGGGGGGMM